MARVPSTAFDGTGAGEWTDTLAYTYDSMGRPDQTKRGGTVLTDDGWNPDDTLATRADGTVGTSSFTYDWAKRESTATSPVATGTTTTKYVPTTASSPGGPSATARRQTLTYDPVKRPLSVGLTSGGSLCRRTTAWATS